MDHWAGFDRLLRVVLGRAKTIPVLGPEGLTLGETDPVSSR